MFFSAGFAAFLLANVLFMTDGLARVGAAAGLMLTPGPLAASTVAITSGRFLGRFGAELFATIGIVLFGLASRLVASARR